MPYVAGHPGHDIVVILTTDSTNTLQFGGITIKPFTYDASFNGGTGTGLVTSVSVEDFPGYHHDTYSVNLKYSFDAIPLVTTTVGTLIATAETAVYAALAAGVGGIGGGVSNGLVSPTAVDTVSGLV